MTTGRAEDKGVAQMTKFYSRERPNSGARPAWLDAPMVALPALLILPSDKGIATPEEGHWWHVQIMLPNGRGYQWKEMTLHKEELPRLVSDWYDSPEEALAHWFGGVRPVPVMGQSSSDSVGVREIAKTSGDLGL